MMIIDDQYASRLLKRLPQNNNREREAERWNYETLSNESKEPHLIKVRQHTPTRALALNLKVEPDRWIN